MLQCKIIPSAINRCRFGMLFFFRERVFFGSTSTLIRMIEAKLTKGKNHALYMRFAKCGSIASVRMMCKQVQILINRNVARINGIAALMYCFSKGQNAGWLLRFIVISTY